ncbi:MAG: hypothetical protein J5701_04990 [Bacteroidales bacterium]|nr:hypothetical protein [Bacteroidales bacterium]
MKKFLIILSVSMVLCACHKEPDYELPEGPVEIPDAVDLGLSVKWASFNIGSNQEGDYGYYYAWGDTRRQSTVLWKNYRYSNSDGTKFTKYCMPSQSSWWDGEGAPDGRSVLLPEDDIAVKRLGGRWRIPTKEEVEELMDTQYHPESFTWDMKAKGLNDSGEEVKGVRITNKSTGNNIFIPYSGRQNGDEFEFRGSRAFLWTSAMSEGATGGPDGAYNLGLDKNEGGGVWSNSRCYGFAVRPVQTK